MHVSRRGPRPPAVPRTSRGLGVSRPVLCQVASPEAYLEAYLPPRMVSSPARLQELAQEAARQKAPKVLPACKGGLQHRAEQSSLFQVEHHTCVLSFEISLCSALAPCCLSVVV